jgi:tellurite methyltransferase
VPFPTGRDIPVLPSSVPVRVVRARRYAARVERSIVGFFQDDVGDWVAKLDCFHRQHVRHDPPFRSAPWVVHEVGRSERVGTALDCPLCDRGELPDSLEVVRVTDTWDEHTMPAGLRRAHRVAAGTWALLRVEDGEVRFRAYTEPVIDTILGPGAAQAIPPRVEHEVEPLGAVHFFVEFLRPLPDAE